MQPQVNQLFPVHEVLGVSLEQSLEHVGKVAHVEFVMEIGRRFAEIVADLG